MNFENIPTQPTINDFLIQFQVMMAKWTAEGNKDSEPSTASAIKIQVENREISPQEGINRLLSIDLGRIER